MDFKGVIKDKETRVRFIYLLSWIPNKLYLKMIYYLKNHIRLNLKNPVGFNDKINWLKLYDKHPEYTQYVDKIAVKKIVASKIGEKYIIPTIEEWGKFDEIDFEKLPNQFVLKCNHDSGSVLIVKDKRLLTESDIKNAKKKFSRRLRQNPYYLAREYPYKNVKPRIFAEQYRVDESGVELKDYKFFCFNGEPKFLYVGKNRMVDVRFDFYDLNFNHLNIRNIHDNADDPLTVKPDTFDEMIDVCKKLSEGFTFVRIDLFTDNKNVYFGEYTFFPGAGLYPFYPPEKEIEFGSYIDLTKLKKQ